MHPSVGSAPEEAAGTCWLVRVWRAPHLQPRVSFTPRGMPGVHSNVFSEDHAANRRPTSEGNSKVNAAKAPRPGLFTLTCASFTIGVVKALVNDVLSMNSPLCSYVSVIRIVIKNKACDLRAPLWDDCGQAWTHCVSGSAGDICLGMKPLGAAPHFQN